MQCTDHETIEAYALGKREDAALETHLLTCRLCQARVLEARRWDAYLSKAKKQLIDASQQIGVSPKIDASQNLDASRKIGGDTSA